MNKDIKTRLKEIWKNDLEKKKGIEENRYENALTFIDLILKVFVDVNSRFDNFNRGNTSHQSNNSLLYSISTILILMIVKQRINSGLFEPPIRSLLVLGLSFHFFLDHCSHL